jgi:hypothetical protein
METLPVNALSQIREQDIAFKSWKLDFSRFPVMYVKESPCFHKFKI